MLSKLTIILFYGAFDDNLSEVSLFVLIFDFSSFDPP